jgi:hypothetical protein
MTGAHESAASYEALYRELMRRPIPREGFAFPKRPLDLFKKDADDPYERWLARPSALTSVEGTQSG